MAKKLSQVFFSTLQRAMKMQRQALKLAAPPGVKKKRRSAGKRTTLRTAAAAASKPPVAGQTPKRRAIVPLPRGPVAAAQAGAKSPVGGRPASASHGTKAQRPSSPGGKGTWQNFIHQPASPGALAVGRLAYSLYRPVDHALTGLPLIIMLHGCQQTPHDFAQGSRMNQLADQKGFVVAYPQQARRTQAMRCWRWYQPTAAGGLGEADAIADLALALVRKHRLDASRVYIAGLSAGASMAALTALRHPHRFAAAAMHSGAVPGAAHNALSGVRTMRRGSARDPLEIIKPLLNATPSFPGMPALILHGRRDQTVSVRNAVQLARQFGALNGVATTKEATLARATHREYSRTDFLGDQGPMVRLCLLNEVEHAWSGGNAKLKFHSAKGPRASLLVWQFFAKHRRLP